jgi:hypothetical protein
MTDTAAAGGEPISASEELVIGPKSVGLERGGCVCRTALQAR